MTTPDPFVPLTAVPAPSKPREFQVTIVNGHNHAAGNSKPGQSSGFQSLESANPDAFSMAAGVEKKIGEPRVTIQRDGSRITHLRIHCSCGQVIDLACVYDLPQPAPAAS